MFGRKGFNVTKSSIPLSAELGSVTNLGAGAVIGHARMATYGRFQSRDGLHPFHGSFGRNLYGEEAPFAVAHNGNVYNLDELLERHSLSIPSGVDSEVIVKLMERHGPALVDSVAWAVNQISPDSKLAALVLSGECVIAVRRGHPIHAAFRPKGVYLSSREFSGSSLLSDNAVHVFNQPESGVYEVTEVRAL
jgi:glutamine phosphoribosylpyrophosphate amidotransferase